MIRTVIARSLVVSTVVAGGFGVAGTAFAAPDPNGDGACPVVDSDDGGNETTRYVPDGTKMMGLTCQGGSWVYAGSVTGPDAGPSVRPTR